MNLVSVYKVLFFAPKSLGDTCPAGDRIKRFFILAGVANEISDTHLYINKNEFYFDDRLSSYF